METQWRTTMLARLLLLILLLAAPVAICASEPAVQSDGEQLLELHRAGLKAHLDSNIEALLAHQADGFVVLNRGEISHPSKQEQREFLGPYLAATKFEFYRDRVPPIVKVSRDGSLGWVMAQVEARGAQVTANGKREPLEFVVAWVELYERQNGQWKTIGNASSFKAPAE
jgi:hypothetical protein